MQNHPKVEIIKRCVACATAMLSLSACSSAGKLRDSAPTAVYAGSSSASDIVSCVSSAWATRQFQIDAVPLTSGTSLQLRQNDKSPVLALVDIVPTGARTIAKYYSQMPDDDTWFFQQVKGCM